MPDGAPKSARRWLRRVAFGLVAIALLAFASHASPVVMWHLSFASELAGAANPQRLHVATRRDLAEPPGSWATLHVANLAVGIPLPEGGERACGSCALACRLELEDDARFAVFDAPPPERYDAALVQFAPDAGDISITRSYDQNWRTIDALTDRVRASGPLPAAFRFETPSARGLVTTFEVAGRARAVIYAYGPGGASTRVLGVVGASEETLERILGSMAIDGATDIATSRCDP